MVRFAPAAVICLLIFHGPDGGELWFRADAIDLIRPGTKHQDHVAQHVNSVLYVGGKGQGVMESARDAAHMIDQCAK